MARKGLVSVEEAGVDVAALREEAAAIRANLEEMAADRAVGLITRPQMLAATERANVRLDEIGTELDHASRENVLAPPVAAENAADMWEGLDISRKRAVIKTLMTLPPSGTAPGKACLTSSCDAEPSTAMRARCRRGSPAMVARLAAGAGSARASRPG
jgi:hypothetical protein